MDDYVRAEVVDVVEALDAYGHAVGVVLLGSDEWDDKVLPIYIGMQEAFSILKGLGRVDFERPLTHDLMVNVLEELGITIEKITVDTIINNVYIATIHVDNKGRKFTVDARPSDAIALAVRLEAPIYVSRKLSKYIEDLEKFKTSSSQ